jgi:hypothetical protein
MSRLMSITTEEYVKRAEECERLAGACIAESNREILLYAAARWRWMAEAPPLATTRHGVTNAGQPMVEVKPFP